MKKRQHTPTSKAAETYIQPYKLTHKEKIISALEELKVGGTQEEIAKVAGMRPDQVWKRLSECEEAKQIFNTGITRKLKSGLQGIVWQIVGKKATEEAPVLEKKVKPSKHVSSQNQQPLFSL